MGSTKSYDYVRQHVEATATMDFVPEMATITTKYDEGTTKQVKMHDGSFVNLHKVADDWDPLNRQSAVNAMINAKAKGEILTGLLYMEPNTTDLHNVLQTTDRPLNTLGKEDLCPGSEALAEINAGLR